MSDNQDFASRLRGAVARAKIHLGPTFSPTAHRGNAYYELATVLRDEYSRTNNYVLLKAAYQLEEQAEITTYSGLNGRAAIIGNYAAMVNNPSLYNVPLDLFSWQIDSAVINFFDEISRSVANFDQITAENINAVDGLVWASKSLLRSFPGTALVINYADIPDTSLVWKAVPLSVQEQAKLRAGSYNQATYGSCQRNVARQVRCC